ncbi:hypothetical protein NYZ49_20025, partial [Acinetobacter baumannii]|nr:hypothetical protein [Acinetobacter baumannii]
RQQGARVLAEMAASHETLILALHDVALALAQTDRIVVLEAGRIVLDAPAKALDPERLRPFYEAA